ncbi:MAG: hypothetical protein LBC92_05000 [Rickettsiales bacterium]|jgi:cell division protein FtsB|nr:hypothetical protein [Rickettsiales bacterium]
MSFNENRDTSNIQTIITVIILILYITLIVVNIVNFINKKNANSELPEMEKKKIRLIKLENDITDIEEKINGLQNENIGDDILDEEIRKNFNYSKKNETIIYNE